MADKKAWLDTPGLKDVLEQEVPLAGKLLINGDYPILIRGAPRIGKSHIRDKVWENSGLEKIQDGVINCAAIPNELAESLLFGHKKGAFTGAIKDKPGLLFDTSIPSKIVFLEEIGELPKYVQAKLLVFFDTGSIMPVGANWGEVEKSTLRIIATSNAEDGKFRPDFLARFWEIIVPAIHERREDVPYFLNHFLKGGIQKLFNDELYYLMTYNWPGGVAEIKKVCIRIANYCFQVEKHLRYDYVRKLLSGLSHFDAWYPYGEFCHYQVWHEKDRTIADLFPHFCLDVFTPETEQGYDLEGLVREWEAWCYFFKQDPKSPARINEAFGESMKRDTRVSLLKGLNINNVDPVNIHRQNLYGQNNPFAYFLEFLNSHNMWNEKGVLLLENLRKLAFEECFCCDDSDEEEESINEVQKLPSFEHTSPDVYRDQFWEYQVKLDRTGREIEEIYGINRKTAERHIRALKNT